MTLAAAPSAGAHDPTLLEEPGEAAGSWRALDPVSEHAGQGSPKDAQWD